MLLPTGSLAIAGPLTPVALKSMPLVSDPVLAFGSGFLVLPLTSCEHISRCVVQASAFGSPSDGVSTQFSLQSFKALLVVLHPLKGFLFTSL